MIDALLARASTRFVFVVGKGGVGKTTTAGALALARADKGEPTHLVSTDPAHSLADLFKQQLPAGSIAPSACTPDLSLEEFAARPYADALFTRLRAPLIELIERGTYLDPADATGFLDLSIPGIDEVMGALRLADLYSSDVQCVVVDTAPTGHTLRLLEAAATIDSWVTAARAMAEKAGVVAEHLVGARITLAAEPLLDELDDRARSFERAVLRQGCALVVTRAGAVIRAETDRLVADLDRRGIRVAAVLSVGDADHGDFAVECYPDARGCAGLRAWPGHLHESHAGAKAGTRAATRLATRRHDVAEWIRSLATKFMLVAGKGGVGKSTCACAIGLALARDRRVCVVSTDPAGSFEDILGMPVGAAAIEAAPGMFVRQIDATAELESWRAGYRESVDRLFGSLGLESAAQLDRNVIESLWNFGPPGLDEMIALAGIVEHADEFDALVIDAAPTGHFLRLIELPEIALAWVHQLLRLLVKYGDAVSLDAFAHDLLGFAKRLRQLKLDLSTAARTAAFVVTLEEPMVTSETARLSSALTHAGVHVAAVILNRADRDSLIEPRPFSPETRWIRAPDVNHEIVGPAALQLFLAQWES